MKIDHLVLNINSKYQKDLEEIVKIRNSGILYEPKYGKGTKGFKATNLWFGYEYFEMINILNSDGGGWVMDWTTMYNNGHRGLICIFIDVDDIYKIYEECKLKGVNLSEPKWLEFKWFFNIFTRRMPWMNAYLPFFNNISIQLGFQQMKDQKSRDLMNQYMYPNSKENGIDGISKVIVYGKLSEDDIEMLNIVFGNRVNCDDNKVTLTFSNQQQIQFIDSKQHYVEVITSCSNYNIIEKSVEIENVTIKHLYD